MMKRKLLDVCEKRSEAGVSKVEASRDKLVERDEKFFFLV